MTKDFFKFGGEFSPNLVTLIMSVACFMIRQSSRPAAILLVINESS